MKRSGGTRGYVRGLWISIAFVAVACLGARPARVSGSEIIDFPVESYSLANGMRVVTERSPDYGTSGVVLLVRAGSANEPAGKAGLAHLTEHLVFRAHHDGEDSLFSRLAQLGGGAFNGYTDWTSTVYFAFVPEQNQERLLDTLQSVLSDPLAGIDERAFTHELQIVNTERQLRTENGTPGEAPGHLARATFPTDHPYAHPVAGTPESLESLTLDDVRDFVKKYYRPAKCILVSVAPATTSKQRAAVDQRFDLEATSTGISRSAARPDVPPVPTGNVSVAEAVAAAERHMGNWHASGLANRTLPAPAALTPTRVPERTLLQDWPGSSQAEIHMDCALQPIAGPRDLAVAEVLTETLGAAFLTELRGGKAGAYNVSTDLEYLRGGTTLVSVSTQGGLCGRGPGGRPLQELSRR